MRKVLKNKRKWLCRGRRKKRLKKKKRRKRLLKDRMRYR